MLSGVFDLVSVCLCALIVVNSDNALNGIVEVLEFVIRVLEDEVGDIVPNVLCGFIWAVVIDDVVRTIAVSFFAVELIETVFVGVRKHVSFSGVPLLNAFGDCSCFFDSRVKVFSFFCA